ncbi:MAG: diaminopimelate decarboxylase [Chloroflexota bacterium]|nr:diaminopimelate decarboxylase [Chloroflexota bacterium]
MTPELAAAASEAAARFGTPLYLYDLPRLVGDATAVREAFPDPWLRLYSLKANGLPAIVRQIAGQGFGASAVSGGELMLAERAGISAGRTALEGIGKSEADLSRVAARAGRGRPLLWVSLESSDEAAALARQVAQRRGTRSGLKVDVLVRINPAVTAETHGGLAVGAASSKFGVLAEELPALIAAGGGPDGPLRWRGIHVHVGSQLAAVDGWRAGFRLALRLLELQRAALADFDTLDAGGGFPAALTAEGMLPSVTRFAEEATAELERMPIAARPARLAVEPGRVVVAGCGWVVGRVLHVRQRERPIVVLDAGMTELIRPALYGAEHPLVALTSGGRATVPSGVPLAGRVRVDGPICESTDTLGEAVLPRLVRGDLVAIGVAGAYGSSMAMSYNGRPHPPEVAWDGAELVLLARRRSARRLP